VFTGLIQSLGTISLLTQDRLSVSLREKNAPMILTDLAIGDSVAVDGVCLTTEEIQTRGFIATASVETLSRSTLGKRELACEYVNLETSLRQGSKIGGHFVTGHVDGIGCLVESVAIEQAWEMCFSVPESNEEQWEKYIAPYLVSKGSIAVNGISLTIADCEQKGSWFKVAVIPHTYQETNLAYLKSGDWVNLECDILGKYVDKLLSYRLNPSSAQENISLSFLAEHGYL
jgi:riboflavin synthase